MGVQRSHQGDIIVINKLITIISPYPETFKITVFNTHVATAALIHKNTSTSEQAFVGDKHVITHSLVWYHCY